MRALKSTLAALCAIAATAGQGQGPVQSQMTIPGSGQAQGQVQDIPAPTVQPVTGQLRNAEAMAGFLQNLSRPSPAPLTILQIGDSHTAGDMLTNGWRKAWQAEYGGAGRGPMAVGKPYQGYLTWGVTARQSPDWIAQATFGKARVANGAALGLSGFTQSARHAGATLGLSADNPGFAFDRFSLCGLTGPDKGSVHVTMGDAAQDFSFTAPETGAACFDLNSPVPVMQVSITTLDDREVSLTSWDSRRQNPAIQRGGIILANMGVVGSRLIHMARMDDRVMGVELRHVRPDLVVIAFGTNEGFDPSLKLDETEAALRTQIQRIRRLLGYNVPILLLGPPDAATSRPDVARPDLGETLACGKGWSMPGHLEQTRQIEMRVAQEMNLAFWDWQGAMGGACASSLWTELGLQRGDHVHFSAEGGRRLGEALAFDLDRARLAVAGSAMPRPPVAK